MRNIKSAQYFLVADTLENILDRIGKKCFINGRHAQEVLEASFEDSGIGLGMFSNKCV